MFDFVTSKELSRKLKKLFKNEIVSVSVFTGLPTYGVTIHVGEKDWSNELLEELVEIAEETGYVIRETNLSDLTIVKGEMIETVSVQFWVKKGAKK